MISISFTLYTDMQHPILSKVKAKLAYSNASSYKDNSRNIILLIILFINLLLFYNKTYKVDPFSNSK